jgi:hypothetical protein
VSIGLAGAITLIEKLWGAEMRRFPNDAPAGFLRCDFLRAMRNSSKNRILETLPYSSFSIVVTPSPGALQAWG